MFRKLFLPVSSMQRGKLINKWHNTHPSPHCFHMLTILEAHPWFQQVFRVKVSKTRVICCQNTGTLFSDIYCLFVFKVYLQREAIVCQLLELAIFQFLHLHLLQDYCRGVNDINILELTSKQPFITLAVLLDHVCYNGFTSPCCS